MGNEGQDNRLISRFFSTGGKAPVRQGCRLPTIPPVSQTTTGIPANIRHLGPYFAQNRAKTGNGEFQPVSWQTASECCFAAISRGRGITGNSLFYTLAMGVPQRDCGAAVEISPDFQHRANLPKPPGEGRSINAVCLFRPRLLPAARKDGFGPTTAGLFDRHFPHIWTALYNFLKDIWKGYCGLVSETPPEHRHFRTHEYHHTFLHPGEAQLITPELIRATCMVGRPEAPVEQVRQPEKDGLQEILFATRVKEEWRFAEEFARQVIEKV